MGLGLRLGISDPDQLIAEKNAAVKLCLMV